MFWKEMAGEGGRSLEQTPTWAVAVICFALVLISIIIEHILHLIGKWFTNKRKRALYEALEKIKSELMLLGFISLLLTVAQTPISNICIPESVANSWHPCSKKQEHKTEEEDEEESENITHHIGRRLLLNYGSAGSKRRILAAATEDKCTKKGKVALISTDALHQLHIFIFVLAVFHVLYCILTMSLGRAKMRRWKRWENETKTVEYQFSHDPERFRFARDTSFGRRHLNFWSKSHVLIWIVCFFRQFIRSVPKVDYLTLRHGFIAAHLAPQSWHKFDFQKYINRSLEEDFKVVVGISPTIWFCAVLFLLFNTHGWHSYLWLPFVPLIMILMVGTKLQVIITRMGLRIQDRGDVVKGVLTVQPADDLFWFNRPHLILYLIHFVLFQNAFQLAFFSWTWYEFGLKSCFHEHARDVIIRGSTGLLVQFLCSYVTLPLYALVTQMGSNMKPTIFNERVATALRKWHHSARKHVKQAHRNSTSVTPMSSRPGTPSHHMSHIHLLRNYRNEVDSLQASPRMSVNMESDNYDSDGSPFHQRREGSSPTYYNHGEGSSSHHQRNQGEHAKELSLSEIVPPPLLVPTQHEINIDPEIRREIRVASKDFSFDKR
ncbi:hypothetical protein GIB67_002042 [Kingdonia uniflora]|uniref:MLO-like protein n=1 Tax=Kingdonia uniflora TaxID=39325 RepID=A0A7J7KWA1_9MAGN|nr:hypothetical protein GIB67_002042 [Kingdonia uniflora]